MPTTEKKTKQLTHYLTFAKSDTALFEFLKGRTKLAVEAADIFYTPIALIESKASIGEIDKAVVRSVALLRAQIEILQGTRNAYLASPQDIVITSGAVPLTNPTEPQITQSTSARPTATNSPSFSPVAVELIETDASAGVEAIASDDDIEDDDDFPMDIE